MPTKGVVGESFALANRSAAEFLQNIKSSSPSFCNHGFVAELLLNNVPWPRSVCVFVVSGICFSSGHICPAHMFVS